MVSVGPEGVQSQKGCPEDQPTLAGHQHSVAICLSPVPYLKHLDSVSFEGVPEADAPISDPKSPLRR